METGPGKKPVAGFLRVHRKFTFLSGNVYILRIPKGYTGNRTEGTIMLWRWRDACIRFMAGRYGGDRLNTALIGVYFIFWLVSLFVRDVLWGLAIRLLGVAILAVVFYRMLSRNIAKRQAENSWFLGVWYGMKDWFRRQKIRVRDAKRWRYRRCPYCKANLRLPIRRGRRTVTCARCHSPFKAFFL